MIDIKRIKDFLLSFIFTKRCRYCNSLCDITNQVCDSCADNLALVEGEICYNCGLEKTLCDKKERKHFYESVCAPYYYDGAPKLAVIHLKHRNTDRILSSLSEDMAECVKKHYKGLDFDACTFVPMHTDDEKKRGYNQAQLMAEKLSEILDIPCYPLLKKDFKTQSQHKLPQMMRSGNLLGTISYNANCNFNAKNTRILLCDDIKTTGATLDECAKTLLFQGCAEVRCITACVGKRNKKQKSED